MTVAEQTPRSQFAGEALGAPRRNVASRIANRLGGGVLRFVLIVIALVWLVPTFGLFVASLRSESDSSASGWWNVFSKPAQLTFSNYSSLLKNSTITHSLLNSVLITVPATVLVVLIAALAGYAFAWIDFKGRDWLFILVVAMLVVPIQVGLIPVAKLFGDIGIFGTIPGVVLFHTAFGLPFAIFLLRNYFGGIPQDLLEAARMDGGSEITIFIRVILPLGLPAIASLAIFEFLWVWNDLLVALIFANSNSQPLTVALQQQMRQFSNNFNVLGPGAFVSLIIPLIVFFAFQRYYVQGVLAGSVK
jgi:alpha-glucoside transport system permease protein